MPPVSSIKDYAQLCFPLCAASVLARGVFLLVWSSRKSRLIDYGESAGLGSFLAGTPSQCPSGHGSPAVPRGVTWASEELSLTNPRHENCTGNRVGRCRLERATRRVRYACAWPQGAPGWRHGVTGFPLYRRIRRGTSRRQARSQHGVTASLAPAKPGGPRVTSADAAASRGRRPTSSAARRLCARLPFGGGGVSCPTPLSAIRRRHLSQARSGGLAPASGAFFSTAFLFLSAFPARVLVWAVG